jgi:hypothetical protein
MDRQQFVYIMPGYKCANSWSDQANGADRASSSFYQQDRQSSKDCRS